MLSESQSQILTCFTKPHFKFNLSWAERYKALPAVEQKGFWIELLTSYLKHFRSREHLLLLKSLHQVEGTNNFSFSTEEQSQISSAYHALLHLNYTISKEELEEIKKPGDLKFRTVFAWENSINVYPFLLNQKYEINQLQSRHNYIHASYMTPMKNHSLEEITLLFNFWKDQKIIEQYEGLLWSAYFTVYLDVKKREHLLSLAGRESFSAEKFIFLYCKSHESFLNRLEDSAEIVEFYKDHHQEFKNILIKDFPALSLFPKIFEGDLNFYHLYNKCQEFQEKAPLNHIKEKEFLKEILGLKSSQAGNFLREIEIEKNPYWNSFFKACDVGLLCQKLGLGSDYTWKMLKNLPHRRLVKSLLGSSVDILLNFTPAQRYSFVAKSSTQDYHIPESYDYIEGIDECYKAYPDQIKEILLKVKFNEINCLHKLSYFVQNETEKLSTPFEEFNLMEKHPFIKDFAGPLNETLEIRVPQNNHMLVEWGAAMHNCLSSYMNPVSRGSTYIFGVFKKEKLKYAMEIRIRIEDLIEDHVPRMNFKEEEIEKLSKQLLSVCVIVGDIKAFGNAEPSDRVYHLLRERFEKLQANKYLQELYAPKLKEALNKRLNKIKDEDAEKKLSSLAPQGRRVFFIDEVFSAMPSLPLDPTPEEVRSTLVVENLHEWQEQAIDRLLGNENEE